MADADAPSRVEGEAETADAPAQVEGEAETADEPKPTPAAATPAAPTRPHVPARPAKPARPSGSGEEPTWVEVVWLRRGVLTTVLAAAIWWFVGFEGTGDWLHLPLQVGSADTLFLGALAASTAVGILVPGPWPRFLVVAAYAGVGWLLSVPAETTDIPHQRTILGLALALGALVGLAIGSRAQRGTGPLSTALAVLSPLCLIGSLQGPLLAVALALPFVHASRDRVAPTVIAVVRAAVVWLLTVVLATALRYGWESIRPGVGLTMDTAREAVTGRAWDLVRTSGTDIATDAVQFRSFWLWVAAALAVAIVTVRASRSMRAQRPAGG